MFNSDRAEILAPAGTYDSFRAAINAGADAVYLGGSMFGARAFAGNFGEEELIKAINWAHLNGRRVYLTVNTLLRDDEAKRLVEYIKPYYEAGLDAAIVQDMGVFNILKSNFPDMDIHASTQMTITGKYGAQLLKDMGASRIVTARELSLKEIKDIHDNVDIEIESFVHGALCYSFSGQCLLSSMIGGRSGNRGRCAQPCRLTYSANGINGKYLLSPKDMCTIEAIPDIIEAGVYSLKIEGRMKSPEYTAGVVSTYRKYLDMYLEKGRDSFKVNEKDIKLLMDIYNRGGFCKGYYYKHNDEKMMTFDRPNHQGIAVGTVKNGMLALSEDINSGDVIELFGEAEFTASAAAKKGQSIKLPFIKGYKPVNGTTAYRTRNNKLLGEITEQYVATDIKQNIDIYAALKVGEKASLTMICNSVSVTVEGDIIEASQNRPATVEDVKKQLLKLGGTAYECKHIEIVLEDNAFLPVKLINRLRREAIEKLEELIYAEYQRKYDETESAFQKEGVDKRKVSARGKTAVQVMFKAQLEILLKRYSDVIDEIYISTETEGLDGAINMCRLCKSYNVKAYLVLPYIFRLKTARYYEQRLEDIKAAGFSGMLIRSPEEVQFVNANGLHEFYEGGIIADYDTYTYNSEAIQAYAGLGIASFTLSEELNFKQLRELCNNAGDAVYGMQKLIYGHLPLMISAGCTLKYTSTRYTSGKQAPCGSPSVYYITDRMKKRMPAVNSCEYCYNMMYNYAPLNLMDKQDELNRMGVGSVRIMFTIEDENKVIEVMEAFLKGNALEGDFTRGHYNRGVE